MDKTFAKSERLCGKSQVDSLYKNGKRYVVWPLRVTYLPADDQTQVLIWAPKALHKKAVDRNHLRRLMREAYRINKHMLDDKGISYQLAFNYMDKEKHSFVDIARAMKKALAKLPIKKEEE